MTLLVEDNHDVPLKPKYSGVPKWSKHTEFAEGDGKIITITGFARLCGTETTAKYRDRDDCTYLMTFIDHDNKDMVRTYENCYESFKEDIARAKVEKNKKYRVKVMKGQTKYVWSFIQV